MKPSIKEVIVVEGKYDANTLHQIVNATVVTTGGFGVFNNRERLAFFRQLAEKRGLILLTDSDGAGFVIRNYLKSAIPSDQLKQAYIPDFYGKERRKKVGSKEGKLGVEGMPPQIILESLRRCGATFEDGQPTLDRGDITKADLLDMRLVGAGSVAIRRALLKSIDLPEHLSPNAMLDVLNMLMNKKELSEKIKSCN